MSVDFEASLDGVTVAAAAWKAEAAGRGVVVVKATVEESDRREALEANVYPTFTVLFVEFQMSVDKA